MKLLPALLAISEGALQFTGTDDIQGLVTYGQNANKEWTVKSSAPGKTLLLKFDQASTDIDYHVRNKKKIKKKNIKNKI